MNPFQVVANWIERIQTPKWLKELFDEVQSIILTTMFQIGKDFILQIESKIISVNNKPMTNREKFDEVYNFAKTLAGAMSESVLNVLINALVLRLKNRKAIA